MKRYLTCITALLLVLAPTVLVAAVPMEMAPGQVRDLMREGSRMWLIDVRAPSAFEMGHIEGAVNIPHNVLAVKRFPKKRMLVLVDNSLGLLDATKAAMILSGNGQERVYVMTGGLRGWTGAGYGLVGEVGFGSSMVRPEQLAGARKQGVVVNVYDLREEEEAGRYPVAGAIRPTGEGFEGKLGGVLAKIKEEAGKSPKMKLNESASAVLVFPAAVDARSIYRKYLKNLRSEIRVMEGGYLGAKSGEITTVSNKEGCPTCANSQAGGVVR